MNKPIMFNKTGKSKSTCIIKHLKPKRDYPEFQTSPKAKKTIIKATKTLKKRRIRLKLLSSTAQPRAAGCKSFQTKYSLSYYTSYILSFSPKINGERICMKQTDKPPQNRQTKTFKISCIIKTGGSLI